MSAAAGREKHRDSVLGRILAHKKEEISLRKRQLPLRELQRQSADLPPARDFRQAISRWDRGHDRGVRLIAELKRASPSAGLLRDDFDPERLARGYREAGASALSVLTESAFFQGSHQYLKRVREAVDLPLLQKDFVLQEYQVWEARCEGADAILLIAALHRGSVLRDLTALALGIGLEPLVEIHHLQDLEAAMEANPRIIGINNRDLITLKVDLGTTLRLRRQIPGDRTVVSESGISSREEVMMLEGEGLDALLIGEVLMRSSDPGTKLRELLGRP